MKSRILIGLVITVFVLITWTIVKLYQMLHEAYQSSGTLALTEYSWFFRLLLNCAGYCTILIPVFLLYKYLERINYFDKPVTNTVSRVLHALYAEPTELPETVKADPDHSQREAVTLVVCFSGLMGSYLVWGLLQEKIMTQNYVMSDGSLIKFRDSQFLVFINRLSAFLIALTRLVWTGTPLYAAPLYKFSYCSVTNILSAWCQYEALKYISFPTQVLSKSCKVIPVMLMGKIVSRNKYELYEYVTAVLISLGMILFMFGSHDDYTSSTVTTISGALLLTLYMACDSFTSSWQGALFNRYSCSPLQMMLAVNACSSALTAASLYQQGGVGSAFAALQSPVFLTDCLLLSASSAVGQLFIFYTISKFGAVVFTIIMTLRQAVSILLSCVVYGHHVSLGGVAGVLLVFCAIFLRVYCRQRKMQGKKRQVAAKV